MYKKYTIDAGNMDVTASRRDCSITFGIYKDTDRKTTSLNKLDIYEGNTLFSALNDFEQICFLTNLYVEEDERGNGYGTAFVETCIRKAQLLNAPIILEVDLGETQEEGFDLIEFYKNRGFSLIEESKLAGKFDEKEIAERTYPLMFFED
ncbi:GNAT family N-acetyltransferase [Vibrio crassostreae]|uniref:GNAT family N-acetyltransferase n=1 Tax=Vibrio crassostreae TaxID=246167 RepID=UPI001B30F674|nr:GNAT family N-acetyltransferase [Vibrio crassostreae]